MERERERERGGGGGGGGGRRNSIVIFIKCTMLNFVCVHVHQSVRPHPFFLTLRERKGDKAI